MLKSKSLIKSRQSGKLSIIKDAELKMRVIAMLDYYSQVILKPIHTHLLSCLRKLPADRTFTQSPFFTEGVDRSQKL
jgi:hypothetical protein